MISFSGIDCGGKSTQIEKIYQYLQKSPKYANRIMVIHSRGGYTPLLEFCKSLVRRDRNADRQTQDRYRAEIHSNPNKRKLLLWLSIFDLALYYGIYFRVCELLGKIILADRYFWDSFIDFRIKYKEYDFEKWLVWKFAKAIYLKPSLSIIYVIPAELSMYRSTLKVEPWPEPIEVRRERIKIYMDEIQFNRWHCVIDATGSIDDVFNKTKDMVLQ